MQIETPVRSIKFNIFPTPIILRKRKTITAEVIRIPRLEFSKRMEVVKRTAKNINKKNNGTTPNV